MKAVYVVLEPQYQNALTQAATALNASGGDLGIELSGYLINQITAQLNPEIAAGGIQSRCSLGEGVLVLGLEHHVDRLHHGLVVLTLHRSNPTISGADLCEHLRFEQCEEPYGDCPYRREDFWSAVTRADP